MKNAAESCGDAVTRRTFLTGSLASLGAAAFGGRVFAAPQGWAPKPKADLVVGILSDTHLQVGWDKVSPHHLFPHTFYTNAMKYFKERNIDAFMHLGDASHRGITIEEQWHRDIFDRFFPGGKSAADGHKVEKLLVCGNHEWFGDADGFGAVSGKNLWPDKAERDKHTLCADMPRRWEEVWGEKYEPMWHKEVHGYHFFGRYWRTDEYNNAGEKAFSDFILSKAEECQLKGTKPFFILSHRRHHAAFCKALKDYPNAMAFFGHWHWSNADWKTIFYDTDTFGGYFPHIQVGSCRMDGGNGMDPPSDSEKMKQIEDASSWKGAKHAPSRQGMIMSVYDNLAVVIERREFGIGGSLGPKWVFPIGRFEQKPFSKANLKKKCGTPEFRPGAQLEVDAKANVHLEADGEKPHTEPGIRISIPMSDGNPKSRAYAYNVVVVGDDIGKRFFKSVFFSGANAPVGHEPDGGVTKVEILKSQLPAGKKLTIAVRPVSSLGSTGKAIATNISV